MQGAAKLHMREASSKDKMSLSQGWPWECELWEPASNKWATKWKTNSKLIEDEIYFWKLKFVNDPSCDIIDTTLTYGDIGIKLQLKIR